MISTRWTKLRPHPEQIRFVRSRKRFEIIPAGRRSGKSEIAKRKITERANEFDKPFPGRFLCAAPTHDQAKEIYWDDIKALCRGLTVKTNESDRWVQLKNGSRIYVVGVDKPERVEGSPIDGIILDEFANMKREVWELHVRPGLDTPDRPGWAMFPSVPEGRNHYFDLHEKARAEIAEIGDASEWAIFHWKSAEILDPAVVERARRDLDPLTFQQEYEGSFVNYTGLAYYTFDRNVHANEAVRYNPRRPLLFCFDFNTKPGVAVICQWLDYHSFEPLHRPNVSRTILGIIGEVHIEQGSTTAAVCRRLIRDWGPEGVDHYGPVYLYGDQTGGARKSSGNDGSDWDIIRMAFRGVRDWEIHERVKTANPHERSRINHVNTALMSESGKVRVLVDPVRAPHVVEDFEKTEVLKGGSGEIDKKASKGKYSHMTDAVGYLIEYEMPIHSTRWVTHSLG